MNRKPGYYWVKYKGEWHIAYYRLATHDSPDAWTLTAYVDDSWWFYDSDFDQIDEKIIQHEP
jgi:hypothetical protein